jgi:hypothetical protein
MPVTEPGMSRTQLKHIHNICSEYQRLADLFLVACREARYQLENPKDTLDAAIDSALKNTYKAMSRPLSPVVAEKMQNARIKYPMMEEVELRSVFDGMEAFGLNEQEVDAMLTCLNKERQDVWVKERKLLPATVGGFYENMERQAKTGATRFKLPASSVS